MAQFIELHTQRGVDPDDRQPILVAHLLNAELIVRVDPRERGANVMILAGTDPPMILGVVEAYSEVKRSLTRGWPSAESPDFG